MHNIFSYEYTKDMEKQLDLISNKEIEDWSTICNNCYNELNLLLCSNCDFFYNLFHMLSCDKQYLFYLKLDFVNN